MGRIERKAELKAALTGSGGLASLEKLVGRLHRGASPAGHDPSRSASSVDPTEYEFDSAGHPVSNDGGSLFQFRLGPVAKAAEEKRYTFGVVYKATNDLSRPQLAMIGLTHQVACCDPRRVNDRQLSPASERTHDNNKNARS